MTLTDTIHRIEATAAGIPSVSSIVRNDIFRLNSLPDVEYAVFGWTQGQHTASVESSLITFNFTFFYVDRLTSDKRNELEIQSVGISVLDNIIRTLEENGVYSGNPYTFTTFNQRFVDECAGVFTNIALQVPLSDLCAETYADFNDDFNEDFAIGDAKIY